MFGMPQAVTAYVTIQPAAALVDAFFHLVFDYPNMRAVCHASSLTTARELRSTAISAVMLATDGSSTSDRPMLKGAYETYYDGVARAILTWATLPVRREEGCDTFAILEVAARSGPEKHTVALI